ncbi:hypothetical protein BDF14DRAFT_1840341 [Spinellus fusiger]|nr:hypothetical protein BDF14DRAFT_1840341 [Spinellus fusiger]
MSWSRGASKVEGSLTQKDVRSSVMLEVLWIIHCSLITADSAVRLVNAQVIYPHHQHSPWNVTLNYLNACAMTARMIQEMQQQRKESIVNDSPSMTGMGGSQIGEDPGTLKLNIRVGCVEERREALQKSCIYRGRLIIGICSFITRQINTQLTHTIETVFIFCCIQKLSNSI